MKSTAAFLSIYLVVAAALSSLTLTSCTAQPNPEPPDPVSVRLKWLHQAQFAGFYVAEKQGFYADENLDVSLEQGGLDVDEIEMVASGENDFGVVDAPSLIKHRSEGSPATAIAVIHRIYPSAYFALSESGIERPADFLGKRVLVDPSDIVLPAMMDKLDLDMDQVEAVPPDYDMQTFFDGEVDVWSGYLTEQAVTAREQGYDLNVIHPDLYGIHLYGDTLVVNDRLLQENPDLVERVLRATFRGWRYAIENPVEAVEITLEYDPDLDRAQQVASMRAQIPLIHTGEDQIGWMQDQVWQDMEQILLEHGTLSEAAGTGRPYYTIEFLNEVYETEQP